MEELIGFFYLILIAGGILLLWIAYNGIRILMFKHHFSKVISVCKNHGYYYYGTYNYKGKGIVYRAEISKAIMNSLLNQYKCEPLSIAANYRIIDYIAIIKYPEFEERYPGIVAYHGGDRMIHFYALEVEIGNKYYTRPLTHYLNNDMCGEIIHSCLDTDTIDYILFSEMRPIIKKFNEIEVSYWKEQITE